MRFPKYLPALVAATLCGCKEGPPAPAPLPVLRVSMIPTTDPAKALRDSQPLADYFAKEAGVKIELTIPTNYAAVVEAIANDQIDIAYLGGFTYVQASARAGVVPLVQRERDQNFHSVFVVPAASTVQSLADLRGHSFAFGDVNSTSGHLMPEYFMREAHVDPDVMAKALYTGGHDATLLAVANGKVDAGAMDEAVFQRMTKEGRVDPARVRVLYTTPPFFDYVWVARKGLAPERAQAFAAALLRLEATNPAQKPLLDLLSATKYVKAGDASYETLRRTARQLGLLK